MLSRVAYALYWMSRLVERAENVARFIQVNHSLTLDLPTERPQWEPLVITTGDEAAFKERYPGPTQAHVQFFLTFDEQNPNSILSCLSQARDNARSVRGNLSSEFWEELNKLYLNLRRSSESAAKPRELSYDLYRDVMLDCHKLAGILDATVARGEGWHFIHTGRMLERADKTSRILDVKYYLLLPSPQYVGTPADDLQWAAVLRSASALQMFRMQHHAIVPARVVEYLLLDRSFPRSVFFCLGEAEASLHAISGSPSNAFCNTAEQRLGQLRSDLAFRRVEEIVDLGLHEFIDDLQKRLNLVGEGIYDTFFTARTFVPALPGPAQGAYQQ